MQWTPLRFMAMVLPVHTKEWLLIDEGGKPFLSKQMAMTVALSIWLMSPAWRQCIPLVAAE